MATIFNVYIANALTTLGLTDLIPIGQTPASPADGAISYEDLQAQLRDEIAPQNLLVNGDMSIDQRNSGAAQTITAAAAKAYTVDRWYAYCAGANVTGQRVAGSAQSQYRYRFTGAASVTAIQYGQRITQANSYHVNGQTVTLSVDTANSVLTTVTWTAYYATTADAFGSIASPTRTQIATGTFTVNGTVSRYNTQISVPSAATTGIEIVLSVGAQTSGTWTIGDVQLKIGSVASDFERIDKNKQLLACLPHMWMGPSLFGIWASTTVMRVWSAPPVPFYATPTAVLKTTTPSGEKPQIAADTGSGSTITANNSAISVVDVTIDGWSNVFVYGDTALLYQGQIYFEVEL